MYIRGMDPLAFAVICGFSSGVVAFLFGGAIFNATWKLVFKKKAYRLKEVILCIEKMYCQLHKNWIGEP